MGADNSKPKTTRRSKEDLRVLTMNQTDINQALQQQKDDYESKYMDFVQSQMLIHQSIIANQKRSPTFSSSAVSSSPSTSSHVSTPPENRNGRNITNITETRPALRSSPLSSSTVVPVASTSSHISTPSGNARNVSNTGAVPKLRSSPLSSSTVVPVPSTSSHMSTPSGNARNVSNTGAIPKLRFSPLVSSGPATSSRVSSPSDNVPNIARPSTLSPSPLLSITSTSSSYVPASVNTSRVSNTGAIPKSRTTPNAPKNISVFGIKCVTCEKDFELQIFQCQNGHSSCNFCKFLNKNCGRCFQRITEVRNITLETTIADTKIKQSTTATKERIKCHNAKDGCCLSFTINEMDNHLRECPYSEIECPLKSIDRTCTWKGNISNIGSHFNEQHPENCVADVDKEMIIKNVNKDQSIVHYVNIGFFNFIIYIEVNKDNKTITMTAQMLGTKVSATKWTYEFVIYDKYNPRRKFTYFDVCYSNTASIKEIFNSAKCAVVNTEYAKTFMNKGGFTYKFFLKQNAKNKYRT